MFVRHIMMLLTTVTLFSLTVGQAGFIEGNKQPGDNSDTASTQSGDLSPTLIRSINALEQNLLSLPANLWESVEKAVEEQNSIEQRIIQAAPVQNTGNEMLNMLQAIDTLSPEEKRALLEHLLASYEKNVDTLAELYGSQPDPSSEQDPSN